MTPSPSKRSTSLSRRLREYRRSPISLVLRVAVMVSTLLTVALFVYLVGYIFMRGLPYLKPSLFEPVYTSQNVSLIPALVNTLTMTLLSLLLAGPVGVFASVYLVEYATRGSRWVTVVRRAAETLSGIPSILYGLFGTLFFVNFLGWGYSLLAGAFTLAIMILPLIMRTSQEALQAVPDSYREGSYGLGAGKLRTLFCIVLPSAVPGILSGIILSMGRILGETAALVYTAGTVAQIPDLMGSGRTLAVHMWALYSEGLYMNEAYATAIILVGLVFVIQALATAIARKLTKG
jgi:phosphate transport system permease protein